MINKLLCSTLGLAVFFSNVAGQTYSSGTLNIPIPNTGQGILIPIDVMALPQNIDKNFGLESVCFDITHPDVGDIDIYLISPDGTTMEISTDNGEFSANYTGTCVSMNAMQYIFDSTIVSPYTGTFRPETDLGAFNNDQNPNGTWQLYVVDDALDSDSGMINSWKLTFSSNPAPPFISSNLPIMIINTNGTYISDEPKKMVDMGIIYNGSGQRNFYNDPANHYSGKIGIELRGSSSQQFPKKPYGFNTWDIAGNNLDTSILGFPGDHDWTLHAAYNDKTLMRNFLAYKLFEKMGHYSVRSKFIELVINKDYRGVYLLTEKISRGNNRINIAKLSESDTLSGNLTGGYIFKIDKKKVFPHQGWESNYPSNNHNDKILFQYYYPKPEKILPVQSNYIQAYIDSFETALLDPEFMDKESGYRNFVDVNSFIDNFIINEISKNVDAYRLSIFLYKDKTDKGGKLVNGPVWDFDLAFHNANFGGGDSTGWQYLFGWEWMPTIDTTYPTPFWWRRFMEDSTFVNELYCRYHNLRTNILSTDSIFNLIDNTAELLAESQERNFKYWPVMGQYVWPNPSPLPQSYQEEIDHLKTKINERLLWIDTNLPGKCPDTKIENINLLTDFFEVYPNPVGKNINIRYLLSENKNISISIFNHTGSIVQELLNNQSTAGVHHTQVSINSLPEGLYFIRFFDGKNSTVKKIVKIN